MSQNHLMFDRRWISNKTGGAAGRYTFKVCPPEKPEKPFLTADKPWESMSQGWCTMLVENGLWRLWYEAWDTDYKNDFDGRLCYAESRDGVNWEKPELGLCEYRGDRRNNIVFDGNMAGGLGFHGHSVFVDPSSPPQARYRMIFMGENRRRNEPDHRSGLVMSFAYSPDGILWTWGAPEAERNFLHCPVSSFGSDTQTVVRWDARLRKYIGYFRSWLPGAGRCIARAETSLFHDWPKPETILAPDERDDLCSDFYNNAESCYSSEGDSGHFMFISLYDHAEDTLAVTLATSRDGRLYNRADRSPFIRNDSPYDRGGIYVGPGIVCAGDACYIAYNAVRHRHNDPVEKVRYDGGKVMLRFGRDRLQGLDTEGTFEFTLADTKVAPRRPEVTLNAAIRGHVRGGLMRRGEYLPGFAPDDCIPATGDGLAIPLSWRGGEVEAEEAELRLILEDATLYSVKA